MATKYKWDSDQTPPVQAAWKPSDSLGVKIETMFTRFVQKVILWGVDFISDRLVDVFDAMMKIFQPGVDRVLAPLLSMVENNKAYPPEFHAMLKALKEEKGESSFFLKAFLWFSMLRMMILGGLTPVSRHASNIADVTLRSNRLDAASIAQLLTMGQLDPAQANFMLQELGLPDNLKDAVIRASYRQPTVGEMTVGLWRGYYAPEDMQAKLTHMGYEPLDLGLYKELAQNIPPFQDILRMMRREAFQDDIAQKYGYEEDYPVAVEEWFTKLGYDPKWARLYYRADWTVPSPTMAYEMLHRGLIDKATLGDILKIADFPPFWREKLEQISYNVFTRVDVRRLLQAGTIDRARALQGYKDMGYNDEDAEILTKFAEQGASQDEKDLTKTDVLDLYEEGLTDRGSTAGNLVKMGYDAEEAEAILQLTDVRIAKAARTDLINYTKERYLAHKIEEGAARSELTQIGLKSTSVDRYIFNWQRATEIESAVPSLADVRRWYKADYINETKLRFYLALHRHTPENIEIYVRELNDAKEAQGEQA